MQDKVTGKSRGFGFVTFRNPALTQKVLAQIHYIDGKKAHQAPQNSLNLNFIGGMQASVANGSEDGKSARRAIRWHNEDICWRDTADNH